MGNKLMKISVPLDKDCFIEMECDFCKNRFMLHQDVYESEDNINFFCPICGLPNKINTFFVPEVLEKAQQMAMNYMLEELERTLGKSAKACCNIDIKVTDIDKETGTYCPICGRME